MNPAERPEREQRARAGAYGASRAVGIVACIFSLVVCTLILINYLQAKAADPTTSGPLQRLLADLRERPGDERLLEDVRALDLLARRAYFTSRGFARTGAYMLLGGVSVMVVAFAVMKALGRRPPDPTRLGAADEVTSSDSLARWLVGAVGLALVLVAIVVVAGSRSELTPALVAVPDDPQGPPRELPVAAVPPPTAEEFLANWPSFRGPGGLGIAHSGGAPADWDGPGGRGIRWKTPVPRPGFSSPVVWGKRVFLTGADEKVREVYCFDAENGSLLWRREVTGIPGSPADPPYVSDETGSAAPTMATDGRRVFAIFATGDLACFDFDGNRLWAKNLDVPENPYGHASSLITSRDLLLVQLDHEMEANLFALNVATGQVAWEAPRDVDASWTSPIVVEIGGRTHVILSATPYLISYEAATGKVLMSVECVSGELAPSPAYANGMVFVASEYGYLAGVDVDSQEVAWETNEDLADVSSPLAAGEYMWLAASDGTVTCLAGATGDPVWQHEFDDGFYASPILVGDLIYLMDRTGVMRILKAGGEFELVASAALGEGSNCTPAFAGGRIFIRGEKHLFCVGAGND